MIGYGLFMLVLVIIFQSFLISSYPNPSTSHAVEGEIIREYNPAESYTVCNINKWIKVDGLGWVYFKKINTVDENQLRLFYRRPGLIDDHFYNLDVILTDSNGNEFVDDGGSVHRALIVSSGSLDFVSESLNTDKDDEFIVRIGGQEYSFY